MSGSFRDAGQILGLGMEAGGHFADVMRIDRIAFSERYRWKIKRFDKAMTCVPGEYRWGVVNCAFCGDVAGFMMVTSHNSRFEITRLAVSPTYQRLGFGRQLVRKLFPMLKDGCIDSIFVNVPESSLGAQMFFRRLGFNAIDVIRRYHRGESAYTMALNLNRCSGADDARISQSRTTRS